MPIDMLPGRFE